MRATLLPNAQRQLLEVLADGRIYCYRELAQATGQHSGLSQTLRERNGHRHSLGSKGFVCEGRLTHKQMGIPGNDNVYTFQITTAGLAIIDKKGVKPLADDRAVEDFAERYRLWYEQRKKDEIQAQKLGLRVNPFILLRALVDRGEPMTYGELARATGLASGLPQDLRLRHGRHRSLASLSLIEETVIQDGDKMIHAFVALQKGRDLLAGLSSIPRKIRKNQAQKSNKQSIAPPGGVYRNKGRWYDASGNLLPCG